MKKEKNIYITFTESLRSEALLHDSSIAKGQHPAGLKIIKTRLLGPSAIFFLG